MDINQDNLIYNLVFSNREEGFCDHSKYREWANLDLDNIIEPKKRGQISLPVNMKDCQPYWGNEAPIVLTNYPYFGCEIHECSKCKTLFFQYFEDGGHGSQNRYRLIQKHLIDLNSLNSENRILIDGKPNEWTVYKNPDDSFQLSIIRHDIALGIDIFHTLSDSEKSDFLKNGITSLESRISDMRENYKNYKVQSWR